MDIADVCAFILIALPLYPNTIDGFVYSVNLLEYTETTLFSYLIYWSMFIVLIVAGTIKIILTKFKIGKGHKLTTNISMGINILVVLVLAMTRETYAVVVAFMLLVIKEQSVKIQLLKFPKIFIDI